MDKEELQKVWDKMLIQAWAKDVKMRAVLEQFGLSALNISNPCDDLSRVVSCGIDLKLKRFKENRSESINYRLPVRAFIAKRCPGLSDCLWSGKHEEQLLIDRISGFKWVMPAASRRTVPEKGIRRKIKARSLSKRHDWNTVK